MLFKRNLKIILSFIFLFFSCGRDQYKSGIYIGKGQGRLGEIKVKVEIGRNHKITNIEILEYSDTPGISDAVFENLPQKIISANGTNVEVISGATETSAGVLEAVENALKKSLK